MAPAPYGSGSIWLLLKAAQSVLIVSLPPSFAGLPKLGPLQAPSPCRMDRHQAPRLALPCSGAGAMLCWGCSGASGGSWEVTRQHSMVTACPAPAPHTLPCPAGRVSAWSPSSQVPVPTEGRVALSKGNCVWESPAPAVLWVVSHLCDLLLSAGSCPAVGLGGCAVGRGCGTFSASPVAEHQCALLLSRPGTISCAESR